ARPASPLDPLLDTLAARGFEPHTGETLARFLARTADAERNGVTLAGLVHDYYRWRFGPATGAADGALAARVARYLERTA
ncbi:MAG: DUF4129 domain-containing protein, partial [Gammaproteobacteria bacterium]